MQLLLSVVVWVAAIWAWRWAAAKLRGKGWNTFVSHLAGALAGLVALALGGTFLLQPQPASTSSGGTASTPADTAWQQAYTIISDEYKANIKRTVEVSLQHRVSENDLAKIAAKIKASAQHATQRTFIGYRLAEGGSQSYWATTHYNPDLEIRVLGWPLHDAEAMNAIDLKKQYPGLIGSWLVENGIGRMALYTQDGRIFVDSVFPNGAANRQSVVTSRSQDGGIKLKNPDNERDEYMTVYSDGTLRFWGESGSNFLTAHAEQGELDLTPLMGSH